MLQTNLRGGAAALSDPDDSGYVSDEPVPYKSTKTVPGNKKKQRPSCNWVAKNRKADDSTDDCTGDAYFETRSNKKRKHNSLNTKSEKKGKHTFHCAYDHVSQKHVISSDCSLCGPGKPIRVALETVYCRGYTQRSNGRIR